MRNSPRRLVGLRKLFDARQGSGAADLHGGKAAEVDSFNAIFAAAEPYRGKNMVLAVSRDVKRLEVLAADADGEKVMQIAEATGRPYLVMYSPPAADAPVFIPTIVDATPAE